MKTLFAIVLVFALGFAVSAQENDTQLSGTIKVQKKGQLSKVLFDNINYRLVGIDQYGNVMDSAVVEFQMSVRIKEIFYSEKTSGPILTLKMQLLLGQCDQTTKILFDNINAKDRNGTIVKMPKFQYTFGYSEEGGE